MEARRLSDRTGAHISESREVLQLTGDFRSAEEELAKHVSLRQQQFKEPVLGSAWIRFAPSSSQALGIDETIAFIQSLGLELEEPIVLAIAYELQSPQPGCFPQPGFVDGFARYGAKSLEDFRVLVIPVLATQMRDLKYFREVYRYTFRFVAAGEGRARMLPLNLCCEYWKLLLQPRFGNVVTSWLEFTQGWARPQVGGDTWDMLLEFCIYSENDPNFEKYDDQDAWPLVFDEFVAWKRSFQS